MPIHLCEQPPFLIRREPTIATLPGAWLAYIQHGVKRQAQPPLLDRDRENVAQ
ncbi:hypothetical protein D3C72_2360740 [compost metagenome]